jgi:thioredoxin reductase
MPKGMLLRSHWWASNLSDPRRSYSFQRFFDASKYRPGYPVPLEEFIEYGLWFQRAAVPGVDETYVSSLRREGDRFLTTLADGREVESASVVMANGLYYYAHRPEPYNGLAAALVSHSCEHDDFLRFKGKDVIVIGAGQSAIEYSALLHEAGAAVQVVARKPIQFWGPDRANERTIFERMVVPNASIAPGWVNWVLDKLPYLFYRFPTPRKDAYNARYVSGATDWLRERVVGKVTLRERCTVTRLDRLNGRLSATLSDGVNLTADHIVLATGYRVDLQRLGMMDPGLRAQIRTDNAIPVLSHWFESSVPGLYFVGATSVRAFGPLYRFVAGCGAAARRVAASVARRAPSRPT